MDKKRNFIKIDKRYKIKFSYAGYSQYAEFHESNGKLVNPRFFPSYAKVSEIPSVEGMETIEEALAVIKKISYCNRAEIHLINGQPVKYFKDNKSKKHIKAFEERFEKFIETEAIAFFEAVLKPLMKKNKWFVSTSHIGYPILIEKNKKGEWDNIDNKNKEFEFEYLCSKFLRNFEDVEVRLESEHSGFAAYGNFCKIFNLIPSEYFDKNNFWINVDNS